MKKPIGALIASILAIGLVGCSSSSEPESTPPPAKPAATENPSAGTKAPLGDPQLVNEPPANRR